MKKLDDLLIEDIDLMYDDHDDSGINGENPQYSGDDGFIITMNNRAHPDLYYWSQVTGFSVEEIIERYNGKLIWLDPEQYKLTGDKTVGWITKDQYLTGRIEKKYKLAKEMNESTGLFEENIKLLRANLPDRPDSDDIHISLGAPWVPTWIIEKFLVWLFGLFYNPKVEIDTQIGKKVVYVYGYVNQVKNYKTYGTKDMAAVKIIEHILNGTSIKAYDQVPKDDGKGTKSVVNTQRTIYLNEKAALIKERWQEFIKIHDKIADAIWKAYNDNFGYHMCRFDGSYLKLSDANPDIILYPYQKDAIAHGLFKRDMLLAHCVGAGKTWIYSSVVHETIRLGLSSKALIVVPNATLEAAAKAYKEIYKDDKVLVVHPKKEFKPDKRKSTIDEIKSDKHQVIFMAYSSFDMLSMSKEYALNKKKEYIQELVAQEKTAKTRRMGNYYNSAIKRAQDSYNKLRDEYKETECTCFDELGIDHIVVDEAHNYKNLSIYTGYDNIVGFNTKGSAKANKLLEKIDYLHSIHGRVIMATGTPITNSMAELYVFQRYLQPTELKLANIYHFTDWIATFAEESTSFEVDVDSVNGKFATRFSSFHNLPELMAILSETIDFYQADPEDENLPDFNGYQDVVVKKNKAQAKYIAHIAERTEAIRTHAVPRTEDNLLKVTVQGRMAATDIRLVDADAVVGDEDNKVKVCAANMAKLYHQYPDTTQIAFSDIGTPKDTFNLYDELKKQLVKIGVKPEDVAFIHDADSDAKRDKLEKQFNNGDVRILVGSTQKLGTGVNVQSKLLAVHHVDVPWRPADMVQREGRIIRQGNLNEEVFIYRYITEASFDAYTYQLLESKQKFISQFLSGALSATHRDETDCSDTVLSYAEVKALAIGNPLIKERVEVSNRLEHAKINQRAKRKELVNLSELIDGMPDRIRKAESLIDRCIFDNEHYENSMEHLTRDYRIEFGEELMKQLAANVMKDHDSLYTEYQGFGVWFPKHMKADEPYVIIHIPSGNRYTVNMDFRSSGLGCAMRIDYLLNHLDERLDKFRDSLEDLNTQLRQAVNDIDQGNPYDEEVERLAERLDEIDRELKEDVA